MTEGWKDEAFQLAASIARITSIEPLERWLTDRLVEFNFRPANLGAAPMTLIVSELEVVFGAGRGTRVELDGPGLSAADVESLAAAVASGLLSEVVTKHKISFVLRQHGHAEISGTSRFVGAQVPPYGLTVYEPYGVAE